MKIAITSKKGGATKSTQAKEIAFRFDLPIINLDIDSHIKEYYPTLDITDANENELIPQKDNCIYDFPAGDIFSKFPNTKEVISSCDLVVIPTLYASESVDRAIDTYKKIAKHNDNIIFVVSQIRDKSNVKDTIDYIQSMVNQEIVLIGIRYSLGMENAEDDGCSIYEVANKANKLIARNYKKGIIADYEEFFNLIELATEQE